MASNILIVDSHPLYREGLKTILRGVYKQARFYEAATQKEAVLLSQTEKFSLITLELRVSGAEGYSCLRQLLLNTSPPPIVIVSSIDSPKTISKALTYGAIGYLPKSYPQQLMTNALNVVASGGSFSPASTHLDNLQPKMNRRSLNLEQPLFTLTSKQQLVLKFMTEGKTNKEIASAMKISETTVKVHVSAILRRLNASNRVQAALIAKEILF